MGSKKFLLLLVVFCFHVTNSIFPVIAGSDSAVSIVGATTFLTSDNDSLLTPNYVGGFGWMKNGFYFSDAGTTCTFNSVFPVAGTIGMDGGLLYLTSDLVFTNPTLFDSTGIFYANNHAIDLASSVTQIPGNFNTVFSDANISLNNDLMISGTIKFHGDCTLDGRRNNVTFCHNGAIIIDSGSSLTLKNLEISGIQDYRLLCLDNSATLLLDNVSWSQCGDYTFTNGSITFINDVIYSNSLTFKYDSPCTSTIKSESMWQFTRQGTLEIGRYSGFYGREPLYFEDASAIIMMNNGTLSVTSSGMALTRGSFIGDSSVILDVNSHGTLNALAIGDGVSVANDLTFKLYPDAAFHLRSGDMVYNDIDGGNFLASDVPSIFIRHGSASVFHVNQTIVLSDVTIEIDPYSSTRLAPGKNIYYEGTNIETAYGTCTITATYINGIEELFGGNGSLYVSQGFYPFFPIIEGTGNTFSGPGDIYWPITFSNSSSNLYLDMTGRLLSDVNMNGGTIILEDDLRFGDDAILAGVGTVQASAFAINLPLSSVVLPGTIDFVGSGAILYLNSDITLASQITLNGNWVVDGNGNFLDFGYSGSIIVGKNSFVKFKNITMQQVGGNDIRCFDNSGSICFDRVSLYLSNDYSFTVGSFDIESGLDLYGSSTFIYESSQTSTINSSSYFWLQPNTTLSIGRQQPFGRQPLYFEDRTSQFIIDNATWYITPSGMQVTRGTIIANREALIDINSTATWNGLIFGDGTPANDVTMEWNAAAIASIPKGHVSLNVTNPDAFVSRTRNTEIVVGSTFYLNIEQDFLVQNLSIESNAYWTFVIAPGKTLSYLNYGVVAPGTDYVLTGVQYDEITTLLAGNQSVVVNTGYFPMVLLASGTGNELYGFGGISGPIMLTGPTAELTVGLANAVTYGIDLNGGTIILSYDLFLENGAVFTGAGTVVASDYMINLPPEDVTLTCSVFFTGTDAFLVLNSDVTLAAKIVFDGNWTIIGNNRMLDFAYAGSLCVNKNSQLRFKDVQLRSVGGNDIYCFDDSASIIFDNAELVMENDFSFTVGSFTCQNRFELKGTATFWYQSNLTSTVNSYSELSLNPGATIVVGKSAPYGRQPLYFADNSAQWNLNNSNIVVTSNGIQFTRGALTISRDFNLDIQGTGTQFGFIIGDGTAANDPTVELYAGSLLHLPTGYLVYNGYANNLIISRTQNTLIEAGVNHIMYVNRSLSIMNLGIKPDVTWDVVTAAGTQVTYNDLTIYLPGTQFQITGQRFNSSVALLGGNGAVISQVGTFPLPTVIEGSGNSITGMGNVSGPINMIGSTAQLAMGIYGTLLTNITMSGGTLTLDNVLTFGSGSTILGTGTVNIQGNIMQLSGADSAWTSTLTIQSTNGIVAPVGPSTVHLSGTWTFSGATTFNGRGCVIDLGATGNIVVQRGSSLKLTNVTVKNISGTRLRCLDNAGVINLDDVELIQSGNVTFGTGTLNFYDDCVISGSNTTFAYRSPQISSIGNRSTLYLDENVTFSYDPVTNNRTLLRFQDSTATMILNNATLFSTPTGLHLTQGTLQINGDCPIISKARTSAEGIIVGDGVSAANDLVIDIFPSSVLDLQSGYLIYNNLS